jgi:hypothetical protein
MIVTFGVLGCLADWCCEDRVSVCLPDIGLNAKKEATALRLCPLDIVLVAS